MNLLTRTNIENNLVFLKRVTLNGEEAEALVDIQQKLVGMLQTLVAQENDQEPETTGTDE